MMFAEELFLVSGKCIQLISLGLFLQSVRGERFFQEVTKCAPLSPPDCYFSRKVLLGQSVFSKQSSQPLFPYTCRSGQEILIKSMIIMDRTQPGLLDSGQSFP